MTATAHQTRREALRRAALGAGALAVAGGLRPSAAAAQSTDDEDLRDFLVEAIALEQLTAFAYATFADSPSADRKQAERLRDHEQAHANALRSALDSLGFDAPEPPSDATDAEVFEDVEGLSDEASERLTDLLSELAGLSASRELLAYLTRLEADQLALYIGRGPDLDSEDLSTTAAEIAGCQAQHLIALRIITDSPAEALDAAAQAVARAAAEE